MSYLVSFVLFIYVSFAFFFFFFFFFVFFTTLVDVRAEPVCESDQLTCRESGECLPPESRCNGVSECADGSDEMGCPVVPGIFVWFLLLFYYATI